MEDVNTATKVATSMVVMCFLVSIGIAILLIGKSFWDNSSYVVDRAVSNVGYSDAFSLASRGEPVPVASVFRVLMDTRMYNPNAGSSVLQLTIVDKDGNTHVNQKPADLRPYLTDRCWMSYSETKNLDTGTPIGGSLWMKVIVVEG